MLSYISRNPKPSDIVIVDGETSRFIVTKVDADNKTANLRSLPRTGNTEKLLENISFEQIYFLDDAPQIMRERTRNK